MKITHLLLMFVVAGFGVWVGRACAPTRTTEPISSAVREAPPAASPPAPATSIDALRRGADLQSEPQSMPMARVENQDLKRARNYPMQPPTIPHAIDGYQVDQNSNRCMLCHGQAHAARFQAPPVSVTHYNDRDGQTLAEISPRRYFCQQCHVVQTDATSLVHNQYLGADELLGGTE
jgi:nitrate reductase (cytochrome), electron transfer subunit